MEEQEPTDTTELYVDLLQRYVSHADKIAKLESSGIKKPKMIKRLKNESLGFLRTLHEIDDEINNPTDAGRKLKAFKSAQSQDRTISIDEFLAMTDFEF